MSDGNLIQAVPPFFDQALHSVTFALNQSAVFVQVRWELQPL